MKIGLSWAFEGAMCHFDLNFIYPQTAGGAEEKIKKEESVRFSPFPRIFRFLLLCRTDVLMIVSCSVFDAKNDDEIRFTLYLAVVEILHIQLLSKLSKCSQYLLQQRLRIE